MKTKMPKERAKVAQALRDAQKTGKGGKSQKAPDFSLDPLQAPTTTTDGGKDPTLPSEDRSGLTYQGLTNGQLYNQGTGDTDEVALNDIDQGSLGDCYFLAALGALAHSDPQKIKDLIKDNGDGTYDVTLYDYNYFFSTSRSAQTITVTPTFPTNASGNPAYAQTGDGPEFWVMLMEKALAQHEGGYDEIEGGNPGDAMEMLTGQSSTTTQTSGKSETQILNEINTLINDGKPVTASSKSYDDDKKKQQVAGGLNIVTGHAYVVESVDVRNKTIKLYNPHGHTHLPNLSISDFKKHFYRYQNQ